MHVNTMLDQLFDWCMCDRKCGVNTAVGCSSPVMSDRQTCLLFLTPLTMCTCSCALAIVLAQYNAEWYCVYRSFAGEALERERFGADVLASYKSGLQFAKAKSNVESLNR